jgi:hypothetical protein
MEGTKLVTGRHDLSGLPDRVAEAVSYDAQRGWDRVVYCLLVNHLAEIAATVAESACRADRTDRRQGLSGPDETESTDIADIADRVLATRRECDPSLVGDVRRSGRPDALLPELWAIAREVVAGYAGKHEPPQPLADLLAGAPLPAKANLGVRWARSADRDAGYVLVANPLPMATGSTRAESASADAPAGYGRSQTQLAGSR